MIYVIIREFLPLRHRCPSWWNIPSGQEWEETAIFTGYMYLYFVNETKKHQTAAGLKQSVESLTTEWKVVGSIPGTGPTLRVLKWLRNEDTAFALQIARPSHGSDDHVEWRSRLGDIKIVSPISTFMLNTLTLKQSAFFLMKQKDQKKTSHIQHWGKSKKETGSFEGSTIYTSV